MAVNSDALAEMEVPESYLDSLPKVLNLAKRLELYQSAQSKIDTVAWSK